MAMTAINRKILRVAFQGEPGAFSEAAAIQLLGESITTVPRATFEGMFHSIPEGAAEAILAPVENSLAGSVVRVFDLLLESRLAIVAETILPIAMRLAHRPGALLASLEPFAKHGVNLLKIESRPIHGRPWEYQFFIDVEAEDASKLDHALTEVRSATSELRVLGRYKAASR